MALNRNGIQKIRLIRSRIQNFICFAYENVVSRPGTDFVIFLNVHQFFAGKGIKSHIGKYFCAAVEITAVVMQRMSRIANLGEITGDTFARCGF